MKYQILGKTGLKVSEVGFGAWGIGGKGWGGCIEEDARAALDKAWELGVNLFDTCDAYGDGLSERLIGEFLQGKREQAIVVTKGGTNFRVPERSKNFERDYLMMCLDESLERLRTDYVDIYLLHVPDAGWQEKGRVLDTLKEMKDSGKVKHPGLAMWGAADTLHAFEIDKEGVIEVLECPFNILNKSNLDVVKIAKERNIGVLTSQPLASGILTGKYQPGTTFPEGDNRQGFWTKERWESLMGDLEVIKDCVRETGLTWGELVLAYNLSYPGIQCVIPGAKNPTQAEKNTEASGKRLEERIMKRLMETKGFVF